jgi:hypothetical protein
MATPPPTPSRGRAGRLSKRDAHAVQHRRIGLARSLGLGPCPGGIAAACGLLRAAGRRARLGHTRRAACGSHRIAPVGLQRVVTVGLGLPFRRGLQRQYVGRIGIAHQRHRIAKACSDLLEIGEQGAASRRVGPIFAQFVAQRRMVLGQFVVLGQCIALLRFGLRVGRGLRQRLPLRDLALILGPQVVESLRVVRQQGRVGPLRRHLRRDLLQMLCVKTLLIREHGIGFGHGVAPRLRRRAGRALHRAFALGFPRRDLLLKLGRKLLEQRLGVAVPRNGRHDGQVVWFARPFGVGRVGQIRRGFVRWHSGRILVFFQLVEEIGEFLHPLVGRCRRVDVGYNKVGHRITCLCCEKELGSAVQRPAEWKDFDDERSTQAGGAHRRRDDPDRGLRAVRAAARGE